MLTLHLVYPRPWKGACFLSLWMCLFWTCYIVDSWTMWSLCLDSFTQGDAFKIHPCGGTYQHFISFYGLPVFLWVGIPRFVYLSLSRGIPTVPTLGLLWIMFLWKFMYKFSRGPMFSVLSGMDAGAELLGHNPLRTCKIALFVCCSWAPCDCSLDL